MEDLEKTENPSFLLYRGECLEIMKRMPDNSVNAVITDPPYSSGGLHQGDRTKAPSQKYVGTDVQIKRADFSGDNKDQRSWAFWCILWLSECYRIAKEGSPICMFSDWRQLPTATDVFQASGWVWRGIAVWDKTKGCCPCMGRFSAQSEYVIWGSKGSMPLRQEVGCLPGVYLETD